MPKNLLQKSIQEHIFKIRKTTSFPFRKPLKSISLSARRLILRGCKRLKTQFLALKSTPKSESQKADQKDEAATLADVDRFLFENFKSLYINDTYDDEDGQGKAPSEPPRFINSPPNLCGSQGAGSSSSTLSEDVGRISATSCDDVAYSFPTTRTSTTCTSGVASTSTPRKGSKEVMSPEGFTALLAYSSNPYDDFKQSMQEMIDARLRHHGKVDWEFMEELLSCYMDLNDKKSHNQIQSAFVDLANTLHETPDRSP